MADPTSTRAPTGATGVLVLASGEVIWGRGFGAEGQAVGEVCFNTAMTGYQEVMTDPSYAGQIINFTFPHIGNVGTNPEDVEALNPHALGAIVRQDVTDPSNFRSTQHFDAWMKANGRIGISGVDTRALTRLIRVAGAPNAVIAHSASGDFDVPAMLARAKAWAGLEGMDLAKDVTTLQTYGWDQGLWKLGEGYARPMGVSSGLDTNGRGRALPVKSVRVEHRRDTKKAKRSSPSTMASNTISCAIWSTPAATSPSSAPPRRSRKSWRTPPTGCSCRTAPATLPRRANMRCR